MTTEEKVELMDKRMEKMKKMHNMHSVEGIDSFYEEWTKMTTKEKENFIK